MKLISSASLGFTLVELCNLPKNPSLEGLSLVRQLNDPTAARDRPAITSSYFGNHSVRSRDWRLISCHDGAKELYDYRTDSDEFRNLVKDPNHQAVIKRLPKWLPKKAAPEFKLKSERLRLRKK
jgi:arylsulfatase A-like enzyme|tara:strand:+ start:58 stop:429 length:372 start_codon:yes stop_codon:yes gene_type:complete